MVMRASVSSLLFFAIPAASPSRRGQRVRGTARCQGHPVRKTGCRLSSMVGCPATLAEAEYEQSDGAAAARSQAADQSGGRVPGQTRCSDARRCSAAARVSYELRHAEVHEHEAARGDGKARSSLSSLTGDRGHFRNKSAKIFDTTASGHLARLEPSIRPPQAASKHSEACLMPPRRYCFIRGSTCTSRVESRARTPSTTAVRRRGCSAHGGPDRSSRTRSAWARTFVALAVPAFRRSSRRSAGEVM